MDDREVGKLWEQNADAWTKLARMGYDIYRDFLNTPAFLKMLPDVSGEEPAVSQRGCGLVRTIYVPLHDLRTLET